MKRGDIMKNFLLVIVTIFFGLIVNGADFNVYKLDNGQTVVIKQVKTNPIVTVDTWIKTGSINENDENNGVSHFLEHLFFKGTVNHAPGEFDKILETKGALTNAATSKDFTHYYITLPSKDFDLALEMHADMLLHPLIPRKELEKERKVVIEEIMKDANSPNTLVYDNLIKMLYTNHPYKRKVIGTKDIVSTIHRDKILEYYNQYYCPGNMITIIAGDVNPEYAIQKVKDNFKSECKKNVKNIYPEEKQLISQVRSIVQTDTKSGYMLIGFRGVKVDNPDSYALDVLAAILGDGRSSVFYRKIKEQKQLAYSVGAVNSGFRDDGIFYISANFTPDKLQKLENAFFDEIENIQRNGVTQEQLNLAKNIIERDTYYARESVSNIAGEIGYTFVTTGDIKFYENYLDNIKKVTAADVKRAAVKYLGKNKSAVSIVIPKEDKEVKISNKTLLPAKLISENNNTSKYQLGSGASLLLTPNEANDIIAMSIFVKGGEFIEKNPGTAAILASALTKSTKNYSSDELAAFLEDNGIKISPSAKSDSFNINVLTTKNEFDKTLSILNEIINNALLDEDEISKIKHEKLNSIKKSRDIPLNVAIENYKTLIYPNSPYSNSNTVIEKSIPKISQKDIKEYYDKIFEPKNIVISVNGNVDKDYIIEKFSKMFVSKTGEVFDYNKYTIEPLTSIRKSVKQIKDLKTAWIIVGWQAPGVLEYKDYAAMQVIDAILGTGMSSRLFKNLRDCDGLAYQLGSNYGSNILRGAFIVYIGTNPENIDYAQKRLLEEVNRLKSEFVGSRELQEAKDKLLGHYIISRETNLDKASALGWFETSGRGYDFQYEKLINSVSESDIIETANKYFTNNYVLSIVKNN